MWSFAKGLLGAVVILSEFSLPAVSYALGSSNDHALRDQASGEVLDTLNLDVTFEIQKLHAPVRRQAVSINTAPTGMVVSASTCQGTGSPSSYSLKNGHLAISNGGPGFSTSPGVPYAEFVPSKDIGTISGGFGSRNGQLVWENSIFENGFVRFCTIQVGTVFAIFNGDGPQNCQAIVLILNPSLPCTTLSSTSVSSLPRTSSAGPSSIFISSSPTFTPSPSLVLSSSSSSSTVLISPSLVLSSSSSIRLSSTITTAALITIASSSSTAPIPLTTSGNLIQNPGFESGVAYWNFASPLSVLGAYDVHSGLYGAELDGKTIGPVNTNTTISQVISTVPGGLYYFSMYYWVDLNTPSLNTIAYCRANATMNGITVWTQTFTGHYTTSSGYGGRATDYAASLVPYRATSAATLFTVMWSCNYTGVSAGVFFDQGHMVVDDISVIQAVYAL